MLRSDALDNVESHTRGIRQFLAIFGADASAQSQSGSAVDFARYAMKLPENTLIRIQPKVTISRANNVLSGSGANEGAGSYVSGKNSLGAGPGEYSWKLDITTTIFWVGEQATVNNPVSNDKSAWDIGWFSNYGGYDCRTRTTDKILSRQIFVRRQKIAETENKVREGLELAVNKREMESWGLRSGRKRPPTTKSLR